MASWQDFAGTLGSFFRLGLTGVRLKDSSGNLLIRNPGDTADANITAAKLINTGVNYTLGTANLLTLEQNSAQSGALKIIYPPADATAAQVLAKKSGSPAGTIELEFISAAATAQCLSMDVTALAFGSSSPVSMFSLPANAVISMVEVIIDTAFNGTPSASVGITGTASKYLSSTQVDLTATAGTVFRVHPGVTPSGSAESLILTYAAGSASAGAARFNVYYGIPT